MRASLCCPIHTSYDDLSSQHYLRVPSPIIEHICFRLFASSANTHSFVTCQFTPGIRVMTIRSARNPGMQAEPADIRQPHAGASDKLNFRINFRV
jgi:hypothetical protein